MTSQADKDRKARRAKASACPFHAKNWKRRTSLVRSIRGNGLPGDAGVENNGGYGDETLQQAIFSSRQDGRLLLTSEVYRKTTGHASRLRRFSRDANGEDARGKPASSRPSSLAVIRSFKTAIGFIWESQTGLICLGDRVTASCRLIGKHACAN